LCSDPPYEKRYPFLDRDLLEFLYAVPREQLLRPGQRRSLMRRALAGIVPNGILDRKRKAFVTRKPIAAISTQWDSVVQMSRNMRCVSLGIVNEKRLHEALLKARDGQPEDVVTLVRTLSIEGWLRDLSDRGIWSGAIENRPAARFAYAGA
jgi:asparagine synthase (glutamine-hydrolysing)